MIREIHEGDPMHARVRDMTRCEMECKSIAAYKVTTNRIANPGKTPVVMEVCQSDLNEAVREQMLNADSLARQDMPGNDGITVTRIEWGR